MDRGPLEMCWTVWEKGMFEGYGRVLNFVM